MGTTSYNVTMIKNAVGNYSRPQILEVLNEVSLILFSDNTMRVERIDPATGMPPFLITTNLIQTYSCPADCREVSAVFVDNPQRQYTPTQDKGLFQEYIWKNGRYYKVAVKQTSALINTLASVTFIDNPGTTTDRYYLQYFIRHVNITDENIQLPFPEELHYMVRDGVIQMLKGENYSAGLGNLSPMERLAAKIRNKLNKGTQARAYRTPWLTETRDDAYPGYY